MTMTATATSALQGLSWDEQIVPTLRKRLESESRAISKRMSAASIPSADEATQPYSQNGSSSKGVRTNGGKIGKRVGTPSSTTSTNAATDKPSAIPRPSLNYSRPFADQSNYQSNYPSNPPSTKASAKGTEAPANPRRKRSRTYSQPYIYDSAVPLESTSSSGATTSSRMNNAPANALPTPASSRSNSPGIPLTKGQPPPPETNSSSNSKPTRIPKVYTSTNQRAGGGGSSSNVNGTSHKADARNGQGRDHQVYGYLAPEHGPDGWQVYENNHYASSHSSVSVPHQARHNGIMNEVPPFSANSYTSVSDAEPMPRPSEEEETPFEHWYRGDLSRNGGVGELRIGNRMEMLEIASYGHRLRQASKAGAAVGRHRRAESIGNRESVIFDDYDPPTKMVLDETPLTDMEVDTELETDRETREPSRTRKEWPRELDREEEIENEPEQMAERTYTSASNHSDSTATATATQHSLQLPTQRPRLDSQIPRATQKGAAYTNRSASEPPESLAASTSSAPPGRVKPSAPATAQQPQTQSMSAAQKRGRTKSPAAPSANKKQKQAVAQKRSKSAIDVRSSAAYPDVPDDPGMADAIPSWTQPKRNGNWDDVVLPVVARKMGLEDQYEEANGLSQPKRRPSEEMVPPAPGTFGYDPTKRRRRRDLDAGESIPMDEFGQMPATAPAERSSESPILEEESSETQHRPPPLGTDPRTSYSRRRESPPPSPAPFSHYTRYSMEPKSANVEEVLPPPPHMQRVVEEKDDAGCCKCIIM